MASLALGCILLGELALRLLTPFPQRLDPRVPHPTLRYVLDPALPDVDAAGFRNLRLSRDIAAIGDSHTYGYNVEADASWPARLAAESGREVYNFGVGGFGVPDYAHCVQLALAQGCRTLLVAFYPANDLADWDYVFPPPPLSAPMALQRFAIERSALVAATRSALRKRPALVRPGAPCTDLAIAAGRVRRHGAAMDLADSLVVARLQQAGTLFAAMAEACRADDARLGVLLIPSKMRVYSACAARHGAELPPEVARAVASEQALLASFREELARLGLPCRDALAELGEALEIERAAGRPLYPATDGHPLAAGYAAYARAAAALLAEVEAR